MRRAAALGETSEGLHFDAMRICAFGALVGSVAVACQGGPRPLRLGTTYTVQQSGALGVLESHWTGVPLAVVVGPSGQILRSAAEGDLDVVITHAPTLEARILGPAQALLRCPFVASRFAVVGPQDDPARVATATTARDAFARIARLGPFVSRGDSSGTHVKELALWRGAGASVPPGTWYVESGADQATTIHLADERNAYALADLPTFAKLTGLTLRVLFAGDTALVNPYTLYVVRTPDPHPAARRFAQWTTTAGRDSVLMIRLPDATGAFTATTGGCAAPGPVEAAR
jgi:tungstate transport system substrate-binding protein